ncbi:hypothetical protein FRC04_005757 [Tulasnella sp. 424]|nr:hypothetical protein FRC04_005757 [Tulasnella sp. 424]
MIFGRIAKIRDDGVCVIGLKGYASLSLLIYDLVITLCMTIAFVWPLTRGDIISARLRGIASRTLVSSIVALITSTINISVLTSMHGKQLGWVCLASCGADVTINAMVIAWVSRGQGRSQRCQHGCNSRPTYGTPESAIPQSPMPRTNNKWRARPDDINWDPQGPAKMSGHGEWSPNAKLEFDFGRRGSAAGLLAPGSGDSGLGAFQEPKSPPIAVPRSGLPFSLPKVSEHATSENLGVDISSTAPGHAVYHLPLPSPRFGRRSQLPSSASQHSETTPPSSRSISLPQIPETTPGAGPSSSSNRHHTSRQRSVSKYGQETVFTQGTAQSRSEPRRSTADDVSGVRGTLMRGLGSVFGLGSRSAGGIDTARGTMSPRPRASRRGLSRDDWTMSVQEKMTQGTATTDISTIVFRNADSQFETSTIDSTSTDTECSSPTPRSRPVTFNPWESSPQSTRGDEHPRSSGDDSEPGCLAHVEKAAPVEKDSRPESSDGPPPYRSRPSTKESGGG